MTGIGFLLVGAGLLPATLSLYLLVLAVASFGYRPPGRRETKRSRLVVLVPAHNEDELIARCVRSLQTQTYPAALYRIVVVADNCSDATAMRASAEGAEVMERTAPNARGKGQALAWAIDQALASPDAPDAFVVVDADSVADAGLLAALEAELSAGADAAQAEYLVLDEHTSTRSELVSAGFLLFHRVRFSGRAALGMPAFLVGNGMLFSSALLRRHPWRAFSAVEDLEHSIDLRLAGVRPAFTSAARVLGPLPSQRGAATAQRLRWEGGRWHVVRQRLLELLRAAIARRDPWLVDAAMDLAVPPLGLLLMVSAAGLAISGLGIVSGLAPQLAALPWLVAIAATAGFVGLGLASAGAPRSTYRALLSVPIFLAWKLEAYLKLLRGFDAHRWDRSDRSEVAPPAAPRRIEIAGVEIDPVNMDGALDRLRQALAGRELFQVATINLDFLVRAQTSSQIRDIFRRTSLNLADGAPLVWLGRLLGHRVPARVAGADLVPLLMCEAARMKAGVFLFGGEGGVAEVAAARLSDSCPGLRIAGWYEPPRASIDEMDSEAILQRVADSGARILLVALGHPKQELWIDRHRDRLDVSIAIGVGCVFDLLAGRTKRAPSWMQYSGLEWLFRLALDPTRLFGRYASDASWLLVLATRTMLQRLRRTERLAHE